MPHKTRVSVVHTHDRAYGVATAVELLGEQKPALAGKPITLKPNFNSGDPFPAGTHNDTLEAVIRLLRSQDVASIVVAERSGGSWKSHEVADQKGVRPLFEKLGVDYVILDDLSAEEWIQLPLEGGHWSRGIEIPRLYHKAESIVMTCCLKTHAFGGHFTMSLKNAVGLVAPESRVDEYKYMKELHTSPHQRSMIAEINQTFSPDLIVLDGLSAFITGGPAQGEEVHPGLMLASTDRIAIDAVGVAILRTYETTPEVAAGKVFDQEQIRRAVELELGVSSPEDIELVPGGDEISREWVTCIRSNLDL